MLLSMHRNIEEMMSSEDTPQYYIIYQRSIDIEILFARTRAAQSKLPAAHCCAYLRVIICLDVQPDEAMSRDILIIVDAIALSMSQLSMPDNIGFRPQLRIAFSRAGVIPPMIFLIEATRHVERCRVPAIEGI